MQAAVGDDDGRPVGPAGGGDDDRRPVGLAVGGSDTPAGCVGKVIKLKETALATICNSSTGDLVGGGGGMGDCLDCWVHWLLSVTRPRVIWWVGVGVWVIDWSAGSIVTCVSVGGLRLRPRGWAHQCHDDDRDLSAPNKKEGGEGREGGRERADS